MFLGLRQGLPVRIAVQDAHERQAGGCCNSPLEKGIDEQPATLAMMVEISHGV